MLRKRNGIYHCDFTVNDQRYLRSLDTTDWREAGNKEKHLIKNAQHGKLGSKTEALARVRLPEAFDRYLKERELEISNARHESDCSKPLRPFFQERRLNQIRGDDTRALQAHCIGQGKKPKTVNLEVGLLLRLLRRAKLRHHVMDDVKMLKVVREPRHMLTLAGKQRVFEAASTKPEWQTAYCAALLTANTSMRPKEFRRLLWNDVDSFGRLITVRRSKTEPGMWVIPMNDEACSAVALSNTEPTSWGSTHQSTMSFIGSGRRLTQPERWAVGDLRGAHSGGRGEASKEKGIEAIPRLAKLRFYDLRHQFVTELCEAGVPESVIRELCWSRGPRHDANLLPPESGRETGRG